MTRLILAVFLALLCYGCDRDDLTIDEQADACVCRTMYPDDGGGRKTRPCIELDGGPGCMY